MTKRREKLALRRRSAAAILSFLLLQAHVVFAGGPLVVGGPAQGISGVPLVWDNTNPVTYRADRGPSQAACSFPASRRVSPESAADLPA